jgi:hypothetical protein
MRLVDKTIRVSRRRFLGTSTATLFGTVAVGSGTMLLDPKGAWAIPLKNLKPRTMATLIQMARDTYPHDRLTDATYAKSVADYDDKAADPNVKKMLEGGCAMLDKKAQAGYNVNYVDTQWEEQRTGILRELQNTEFFQTIRGGLVTGLYNQPDIWQKFGYEGSSYQKGGYLHRGFNDIDWLPGTKAAAADQVTKS